MNRPSPWGRRVSLAVAIFTSLSASAATVSLQTSSLSPTLGQPLVLTAAVQPSNSTGTVSFFDGVRPIGVGPIASGQSTITTTLLAAGRHTLYAQFGGSKSAPLAIVVRSLPEFGFHAAAIGNSGGGNGLTMVGDFNNDGIPDIVRTSFTILGFIGVEMNWLGVWLGNGDGTFRAGMQMYGFGGGSPVAVGDFDGDGKADLATFSGVYLGNGDGTFQSSLPIQITGLNGELVSVSLAVADFNGDGRADLAWSGVYNGTSVGVIGVLPGNGDGTFGASINKDVDNGGTLAVGDFNADGLPDLAVTEGPNSGSGAISVLLGKGDGTFTAPALYALRDDPQKLVVADFDGDGRDDVAVGSVISNSPSDISGVAYVLLSNPDGTLRAAVSAAVPGGPSAIAASDFNGDGRMDLAFEYPIPTTYVDGWNVALLFGNGDGTLQSASTVAAGISGPFAIADFNGDGRADIAPGGSSQPGVLLGNAAPQGAPAIGSVLNAASFQASIAPGSWVAIQGSNLANTTRLWRSSDFAGGSLPTVVDGVSVTIGGNPAFVEYVSPTQINVQAPSMNAGTMNVVVTNNGAASAPASVTLQTDAPAFFTDGGGHVIASVLPGYSAVTAATPAHPGDIVVLWGTGFGPTNPPAPAGIVVTGAPSTTQTPLVTIGGIQVAVVSSVLTSGTVGLYQVTVQLPPNLPAGTPAVQASIGGASTQSGVTLPVGQQ